jgi:DNA-binding XRE family transcriptional regulator
MGKKELSTIRRYLGKTQCQMAQLLGVSSKAIQSFEQGWRNIPVHAERQALFLLALKKFQKKDRPCRVIQKCPSEIKQHCPAWELQVGHHSSSGSSPQAAWKGNTRIKPLPIEKSRSGF